MKNILLTIILIFLVIISGCSSSNTNMSVEIMVDKIEKILYKESVMESNSLKIMQIVNFNDKGFTIMPYDFVVLESHDFGQDHYVGYNFFDIKGDKVIIHGGSYGIVADTDQVPVTFSVSSGNNNENESYIIAYGEVYNESIKSIRGIFTDGTTIEDEVINNGYFIAAEGVGDISYIEGIEGLDEDSNVIYKHPDI